VQKLRAAYFRFVVASTMPAEAWSGSLNGHAKLVQKAAVSCICRSP